MAGVDRRRLDLFTADSGAFHLNCSIWLWKLQTMVPQKHDKLIRRSANIFFSVKKTVSVRAEDFAVNLGFHRIFRWMSRY